MPFLEQPPVAFLDPRQVRRMHTTAPEIGTLKVLFALVAQKLLDLLTYEGRRVVAGRLEAVDHRRRASEQVLNTIMGCRRFLFRSLALADVAPGADHLDRLALFVTDQSLGVVDPAIGAVLFAEAILHRVPAVLVQIDGLGFRRREVVGMHATPPEIRILQVIRCFVTQPISDVLTDESRGEISRRPVAVYHRGRTGQQLSETSMRGGFRFLRRLACRDVAPGADDLRRLTVGTSD